MKSILLFLACAALVNTGLEGQSVQDLAAINLPEHRELYRTIHSHPELSFMEKNTAATLSEKLEDRGYLHCSTQH